MKATRIHQYSSSASVSVDNLSKRLWSKVYRYQLSKKLTKRDALGDLSNLIKPYRSSWLEDNDAVDRQKLLPWTKLHWLDNRKNSIGRKDY